MSATVFLVFPHQLYKALFTVPRAVPFCFIEDEYSFRKYTYHTHALIMRRAAMQSVRERLLVKGFQVSYYDTIHFSTLRSVFADLSKRGIRLVQMYELIDQQLTDAIQALCQEFSLEKTILESPGYLVHKPIKGSFEQFYKQYRTKQSVLMQAGNPAEGAWLTPAKPQALTTPPPPVHVPEHNRYVEEAVKYVQTHFLKNPGDPSQFIFPVTYADAEDWLQDFIEHRLVHYADYYDTMSEVEGVLYHAVISPLLTAGLLIPQQVVEAVLAYIKIHPLPLEQVEYFLRTVIGKREFARMRFANYTFAEASKVTLPKTKDNTLLHALIERVRLIGYCNFPERQFITDELLKRGMTHGNIKAWWMSMLVDAETWSVEAIFAGI